MEGDINKFGFEMRMLFSVKFEVELLVIRMEFLERSVGM